MSRDDEIVIDLVTACNLILDFTKGMDKENFITDAKTQSSVLYQIIILGEAVNRLSSTFIDSHPQIPVRQIKGMRNRVTHEYKEVDCDIIWDAIHKDVPRLLAILENL
ncbi:MAG: DUF86 domain-containing protein [Okeania sp. SIO2C2]|uniref:HepT-like ribonuclease domain-containing protein n=1 Tax=Okeania sp. SIO2C2 TaxID=2607787 RepID=UPI0013B7BEA8|nr:HepT-like ribonuclease domain-containing protein [Okeania sp. SIO2C2]NEP88196.1 DUF86 domain-containing protein [Okeania sp. SIO2C2]